MRRKVFDFTLYKNLYEWILSTHEMHTQYRPYLLLVTARGKRIGEDDRKLITSMTKS